MTFTLQHYHQLADHMATQITDSYQSWTDFLTTAARLYKYPYHDQLMIYAQRPDATACAEYGLWNKRMGRYIRRGAKGIALIDHSGDTPKLRYVFDVADTRGTEHSRNPYLWEFRPEHEQVVSDSLELQYDIRYPGSFSDLLEQISSVKVTEYFLAHEQDILDIVDGSYLEGYHDYDKGVAFINAATVSTTYALLSRCGLVEDAHFGPEDFMPVFDFNTPQTVEALGSTVSGISEEILRNIEVWNLYHDLADEAKSLGHLSCLSSIRSTNYPEETERLTNDLLNPEFRERLLAEYKVFLDAHHENRELLRFHYHRPQALLTRLEELSLPRKEYHSDMAMLPETGKFITEDEIADSLANGSSFEGGKSRIYAFFQAQHSPKECADFLKEECEKWPLMGMLSGLSFQS